MRRKRKHHGGLFSPLRNIIKNRRLQMQKRFGANAEAEEIERENQYRNQLRIQERPMEQENEENESLPYGSSEISTGSLGSIQEAQVEEFGGRGRARRKEKFDVKIDKRKSKNELRRAKSSKKIAQGEAKKIKAGGGGDGGKVLDTINGILNPDGTPATPADSSLNADGTKKTNWLLWGGIALAVLIVLIIVYKMMAKKG